MLAFIIPIFCLKLILLYMNLFNSNVDKRSEPRTGMTSTD